LETYNKLGNINSTKLNNSQQILLFLVEKINWLAKLVSLVDQQAWKGVNEDKLIRYIILGSESYGGYEFWDNH